ncbi:lmo0937 family membrane protein [Salipaludibacillus sp. HK11]
MIWTIVGIVVLMWILGFSFQIGGGLIHLLLVVALIVAVINLITGRRV